MLTKFIKPSSQILQEYQLFNRSGASTAVFGVSYPLALYLTSQIDGRVVIVCKDSLTAKSFAEELPSFTGEQAIFLPPKDDVLLYKKFFNKESLYARISAIDKINNGVRFITTTPESLLQLFPKKLDSIKLSVASEYSLDSLLKQMLQFGYKRTEFAEHKGEFALRGDIFEVFPINDNDAYRIDFFGDDIEKIRILDVDSHFGLDEVRSINILPAIDFLIEENEVNGLIASLSASFKKLKNIRQTTKARQIIGEIKDMLETGNYFDNSLSYLYPLLSSTSDSFLDIFGQCTFAFLEPKMIADSVDSILREHTERCLGLYEAGEALDFTQKQLISAEALYSLFAKCQGIAFQNITTVTSFFKPNKTLRIQSTISPKYVSKPDDLPRDLLNWQKRGYRSIIATGNSERANRLKDNLYGQGVLSVVTDNPSQTAGVYLVPVFLNGGFILHDEKLVIIGTCDVFLSGVREKKIVKRRKDTFTAPEPGDFAVHEVHGIGIVRGTERISTSESTKDYIKIEYAGGDFLYVPVEQMDKLTKYLGGEKAPHLNKIGGVEFDRIVRHARESIAKMTINLKKLYKERAFSKGYAFSPDNEITKEFDDAFMYDLTEDQAQSVAEIKKDMESDKIMDRLLMGDVGFGKTEVAFRCAFKCILDSKQVVLMAPTTILSEQHYRTAVERFKGFGVKIAVLNRFVNTKKLKEYLKGIEDGTYNLVIGTHRLLGKDVHFHDLGLLILDEEQNFGVEAKEKLRTIKSNVDTLTMTATPIPRTLHMSLSGIRGMSLINTPPIKRIPVQTYVIEESDALIRDAVLKELSRGGQTFILYNRVESIDRFNGHIASLLPEAKIVVCHGQMDKRTLENNIMAFYNGEYNVLLCTTIIENGIDLPNANTLIVIDSDKFGLFSLYQLKGRVGRGDKMAHAYFTFKPDKVIGDSAYKRLSALAEHTELGSGYKIAMRDLEIRGAGNVLGKEQHGHMDKIGYELYSKLLREQLGEVTKDYEVELDIRLDAFIPNEYISQSQSRMDVYKTIAEITSESQKETTISQIKELYGPIPHEVENLISVATLKYLANELKLVKVSVSEKCGVITLRDLNAFLDGGINAALDKFGDKAHLSFEQNPIITISENVKSAEYNLSLTTEFIKICLLNQK